MGLYAVELGMQICCRVVYANMLHSYVCKYAVKLLMQTCCRIVYANMLNVDALDLFQQNLDKTICRSINLSNTFYECPCG